jgi:hypothetical protein
MRTPATEKSDLNYGNCPDMINASLTGAGRGKCRGKRANRLFEKMIPNRTIVQTRSILARAIPMSARGVQ